MAQLCDCSSSKSAGTHVPLRSPQPPQVLLAPAAHSKPQIQVTVWEWTGMAAGAPGSSRCPAWVCMLLSQPAVRLPPPDGHVHLSFLPPCRPPKQTRGTRRHAGCQLTSACPCAWHAMPAQRAQRRRQTPTRGVGRWTQIGRRRAAALRWRLPMVSLSCWPMRWVWIGAGVGGWVWTLGVETVASPPLSLSLLAGLTGGPERAAGVSGRGRTADEPLQAKPGGEGRTVLGGGRMVAPGGGRRRWRGRV